MNRIFVAPLVLALSLAPFIGSAQPPKPTKQNAPPKSVPPASKPQGVKQSAPKKSVPSTSKPRGIDDAHIALIPVRMKSFVDRGRAAGIVTLVAHRGQIVNLSAVGNQDMEAQTPMKTDTIFQIASMTKPVTAAGIMILVEDGLLAITDPVQKYLPSFANIQVKVEAKER